MAQINANRPLLPGTLWNVGWRYLLRHPLQTILMVAGIALGVAVIIAIDVANASASRAFDLSVESITGRATHQVVGGPAGLDEAIYTDFLEANILREAAPIVTDYVQSPQLGGIPIQVLGVDPLAEQPFRSYLGTEQVPLDELTAFLTDPGGVLISTELAAANGLAVGDSLILEISGRTYDAFVAGLLEPQDELSRRRLDNLIVVDIATAQELTGRLGRLDRIDLIVPEEGRAERLAEIEAVLPSEARLQPVEARTGTVEEMTRAFRTNLLALSLLGLFVGMFLIYNTMTFSVVQRRPLFGTLRCLGVTRREVFLMVAAEALIVGLIGAGLGTLLGIVLGQGAVRLVTQTVNDLFFTVTVRGVQIPVESLVKGAGAGLAATVLSALLPAWEAASVPPRAALSRSGLEVKAVRSVPYTLAAGLLIGGLGAALLIVPSRSLVLSFGATFLVIVGCALVTPAALVLLMRALAPVTASLGVLGRLAPREVSGALSRTAVAVAALMLAVSVTIGISVMVGSFRRTVIVWLEQSLQGDVYITVVGGTASRPSTVVDPAIVEQLADVPGIVLIDSVRNVNIDSPLGEVNVSAAFDEATARQRLYYSASLPRDEIVSALREGAVVVSEPFARRFDLWEGDSITLYTDQAGPQSFPIVAVYYDYGSPSGTVTMDQAVYRRLWNDDGLTAVALHLEPGVDADAMVENLEARFAGQQDLQVNSNRGLRDEVLVVFDRTFAITGALNVLTTIVAFIGVLSALLSLQLEKQRQLGMMRAIGLTVPQVWGLTLLETGLMGLAAGLLAMPTGYVLSLILVYIINRRSFGWTLQMAVLPEPFLWALVVAVGAALLAALYPAARLSRAVTADAIRFE